MWQTWFYHNLFSSFLSRILKIKFLGSNVLEPGSNIFEPQIFLTVRKGARNAPRTISRPKCIGVKNKIKWDGPWQMSQRFSIWTLLWVKMILHEGEGHIVLNSSSYIHLREILLAEQWHTPASSHKPDQLNSFLFSKYFDVLLNLPLSTAVACALIWIMI